MSDALDRNTHAPKPSILDALRDCTIEKHCKRGQVQGIDAGYWEDLLAVMPDTGMDSAQCARRARLHAAVRNGPELTSVLPCLVRRARTV